MAGDKTSSVLFVCILNAVRSPMAECIVHKLYGNRIFAESAGITAGDADGFVEAVLAEKGMSLRDHEPQTIEEMENEFYDLIVTLSPEAHERTLELTRGQHVEIEHWPTPDPSAVAGSRDQIIDAYRQVRDQLERRICERFGP